MGIEHSGVERQGKQKQTAGIFISIQQGIFLYNNHPEILELYKNGATYKEIAQRFLIDFDRSPSVSINSVYYCMREFVSHGYISNEELREISRKHELDNAQVSGSIGGRISFNKRKGCFAMDSKIRSELSRSIGKRMGKKYGRKNYDSGIGIGGLSLEQLRDQALKTNIIMGRVPYDCQKLELYCGYYDEKEYAMHLRDNVRLSWKDVATRVNSSFGNNRQFGSIRTLYNGVWRRNGDR